MLIKNKDLNLDYLKYEILESLKLKAESRQLNINRLSMRDETIKQRSKKEYELVSDEIVHELPEFDLAYNTVTDFYESLRWE